MSACVRACVFEIETCVAYFVFVCLVFKRQEKEEKQNKNVIVFCSHVIRENSSSQAHLYFLFISWFLLRPQWAFLLLISNKKRIPV